MSVLSIDLHSQGAGGTATGSDSGDVAISYRSSYRVTCSEGSYDPGEVLRYFKLNADYPWMGRPFKFGNSFDVNAITKTVEANYVENSDGKFIVQCTFAPEKGQEEQQGETPSGQSSNDPVRWHDQIDVGFTQISIPVESAIFKGFTKLGISNPAFKAGKSMAIMNSATKPLDPTLEEEIDIKVIRITRNVRYYDGSLISNYQGALNSDPVTIFKPAYGFRERFGIYHGRIKAITAQFAIANGIPYYRHSIELHVFPPGRYGWLRLVLDQGIEELYREGDTRPDGSTVSAGDLPRNRNFEIKTVTDEEGLPISTPVRFNGNGKALAPNEDPVYLIYQTRHLLPFSPIRW
jgi:hypothetical protein